MFEVYRSWKLFTVSPSFYEVSRNFLNIQHYTFFQAIIVTLLAEVEETLRESRTISRFVDGY